MARRTRQGCTTLRGTSPDDTSTSEKTFNKADNADNDAHPQRGPRLGRIQGLLPNGMAWLEADIPVDLPGALPGERVLYQELGRGKHRARGRLLEVLEAHPHRIRPRCPIQDECGSCDRMHLSLEGQHALKQAMVSESLANICQLEPLIPSPLDWGYRRRAKFVFYGQAGALKAGAYQSGTHDLLDLGECPVTALPLLRARDHIVQALSAFDIEPYGERTHQGILRYLLLRMDPDTESVLALLVVADQAAHDWTAIGEALLGSPAQTAERTLLGSPAQTAPKAHLYVQERATGDAPLGNREGRTGETFLENQEGRVHISSVHLNTNSLSTNALLGPKTCHLAGTRSLPVRLGDVVFPMPAGAFSQVNLEVAGLIYREAASWAAPVGSGGAVDLFCGVGALGLHVGARVPWGIGFETNSDAIEAARSAARMAGINNWQFHVGDAATIFSTLELPGPLALAIANPPRKGLDPQILERLLVLKPSQILYLSCNPHTLARDLRRLTTLYRVTRAQPFDMFPQTRHVETLVALEAATNAG